jgi:type IV secretory pathway TraG/TraD family ATPase VirD4
MTSQGSPSVNHQETARRPAEWPSDKPVWSLTVFFLAALVVPGRIAFEYAQHWSDLGAHYLPHYVMSAVGPAGSYWILNTVTKRGMHLTTSGEVQAVQVAGSRYNVRQMPFRLTPAAVARGAEALQWRRIDADNQKLHAFFRMWVYGARPLPELAKQGAFWAGAFFIIGLMVALPQDRKAQRMYQEGRVVRGPVMATRDVFNRKRQRKGRTQGVGFVTKERQSLLERLTIKYIYGPIVRIPAEDEPRHMLLEGNTGGGKSAAIRQLAVQIADRDETAIIYDPALEYVTRFYSSERGDIILNPLDVRAPYWSPGEEVEHDAVALTIAHALFPDKPNESHFFWESVRKLIAHLLRLHPRPEQLVEWMNDPGEIDRRVQGTPYASTISRNSPQQRDGVLGTLNLVADTVRLLKTEQEAKRHWTAREWVKKRQGWIFLTSTPATREALKPLISLWLDLLILRLLHEPGEAARRVWFLLDEVGSLQKLPQLVTAVTENRKSNNPVVMGIQGKAQLETIYGHIAETMLSMPWTALFFKTTEPGAAEWISRYLGVQEIERLRESRTTGYGMTGFQPNRESKTYVLETRNRYAVLESEASGLDALRGYLKSGNFIVPLTIDYWDMPKKREGFMPRELAPMFPAQVQAERQDTNGDQARKQKREQGQARRFFD